MIAGGNKWDAKYRPSKPHHIEDQLEIMVELGIIKGKRALPEGGRGWTPQINRMKEILMTYESNEKIEQALHDLKCQKLTVKEWIKSHEYRLEEAEKGEERK